MKPDFVGFTIPNEFVVGYGLDYRDQYRNLPYLAVLEPNEIAPMTKRILANHPDPRPRRGREAVVPAGPRAAARRVRGARLRPDPRRAAGGRSGRGGRPADGHRQAMEARSAGVLAAEAARGPAPARSDPHLDVRRQHLRFCGGQGLRREERRDRPAVRRSVEEPAATGRSIAQLARRCRGVVVNSEGVRDFYVRHGTPGRARAGDSQQTNRTKPWSSSAAQHRGRTPRFRSLSSAP